MVVSTENKSRKKQFRGSRQCRKSRAKELEAERGTGRPRAERGSFAGSRD